MSTEERDESQPRSKKVIPTTSIRRESTEQDAERKPYNPAYNRPEGNNYERRPYNRPVRDDRNGGYNAYGDRPNRPRYDNREGGYNRPYRDNSMNRGYGNGQGGYGNRPVYGNNRPYGGGVYSSRPTRPNPNYEERGKAYSATPNGEGMPAENSGMVKKRRPRVGDVRFNPTYENNNRGGRSYGNNNYGNYGNNGGRAGNANRRPANNNNNNNRRQGNYNPNAKYNFQKQLKYKEVLADPNEPIRLNKYLSNAGVCSRREADEHIKAGDVKVNDQVITELGTKITRQDKVLFKDQPVQIESKVYIVLNKPKNCVTTSDDPQARQTVMDLVKNACQERIYPVGRLDRNTTGVLLLTNDGDLASKLTHPSYKKKKIYHVWLDKNVSVEDMQKIADGLQLEDGEIHADAISYASEDDKSQVGIEIHSGRNRIVRRIFESLGYHVVKLDRVYFAGLTKKNLPRGKWRYLNEREVNALRMGAFE